MNQQLHVGQVIQFLYPAANYVDVKKRWEQRRVLLEKVRDLSAEPLDPKTVEEDPLLDRGGTLVTGTDVDRGVERSFYIKPEHEPEVVEASKLQDPLPLKIAIVHDGTVRIAEMPDPRVEFLKTFYRRDRPEKCTPQPVSLATFFASSRRRAE